MEKFQLLREEAWKNYRLADHMLTVTYPLLHDTKLLLGVAHHLYLAFSQALSAILYHERLFKTVPSFSERWEEQFHLLHQKKEHYGIRQEYFELIWELKEIIYLHKSSPVEFRHKDRFVICTKNYKVQAITQNQLKDYLRKSKEFMEQMEQIISRSERFFREEQA